MKKYLKRKYVVIMFLSILLSSFMVIGICFDMFKSLKLILKYPIISIFLFIIFVVLFNYIINFIFEKFDKYEIKVLKNNNRLLNLFNKYPFLFSLIFILCCWLIYVVAFYPTILTPDSSNQILQFFGIDNYYSHISNLIDDSVIFTNHNPVIHTLFVGFCVKLGILINNINLGLFLISFIQIILLSSTFSYSIKFLKRFNVSIKLRFLCLLIFSLIPVFPFYAMTCVKDSIFGPLFILYVLMISNLVIFKEKISMCYVFRIILLMIFLVLIRNNGIHIILLSFPFLFIIKYNDRWNKFKLIFIFLFVIIFNFSFNKFILPYFKVTPTSVREKLSIPFQQTARYVSKYNDEITDKEKDIIDKILIYDTLSKRYEPEISDPVKNKFNKDSTKEDLINYFKVWFNQFRKHPIVYFEATFNNTYGYYYPFKTNWYFYYKFRDKINKYDFNYSYNDLNYLRSILSNMGFVAPYIPVLGLVINIGFNTWILLFMISFLFYKKKYRELIIFIPSIAVFMVCIASPVNVYFRYALPNVFVMPILFLIFLSLINKKSKHI